MIATRIGDHEFLLDKNIIINTSNFKHKNNSILESSKIIRKLSNKIPDLRASLNSNSVITAKNYQLVLKKKSKTTWQRLSEFLGSDFFHEQANDDGYIRLSLQNLPHGSLGNLTNKKPQPQLADNFSLSKEFLEAARDFRNPPFEDPFTTLAAAAFQKLEPHFDAKDHFSPSDCRYVFIRQNNSFILVEKKEIVNMDEATEATKTYLTFLEEEHGMEKICYIQHQFGFNFKKMIDNEIPLSPEHVFRTNVGLALIELADLDVQLAFIKEIRSLISQENEEEPLDHFFQKICHQVPGHGKRHALRGLRKVFLENNPHLQTPSTKDFQQWAEKVCRVEKASELPEETFSLLIETLICPDENFSKIFTGRDIFKQTKSGYATAGKREFKPWIDSQELLRTFPDLNKEDNWELFYEKLVFCVVKYHLAKQHPDDQYRVGTLLPAPSMKGKKRWYVVSSCVNNGYGIFSYTLESLCPDATLPTIKLYRSTSSSAYQIDSKASIRNDVNPWNSPGYEGTGYADKYEQDLFNKHTIPLWVAYLEQAKAIDGFENDAAKKADVASLLQQAVHLLKQEALKTNTDESLRTFLKRNDALLNDLYFENYWTVPLIHSDITAFRAIYNDLHKNYGKEDFKGTAEEEKKAFLQLENSLVTLLKNPSLKNHHKAIEHVVEEMQRMSCDTGRFRAALDATLHYKKFKKHLGVFGEKLLSGYCPLENMESKELQDVIQALDGCAEKHGEHVKQKARSQLVLTGHSLGGACAQAQYMHYVIKRNRLPVPHSSHLLKLYDSPKINKEDNAQFKSHLIANKKVMQQQNIQLEIHSFQEVSDPVVLGGEEHLGAAFSQEERLKLDDALKFTGILRKREKHCQDPAMREAKTAHATQFAKGKEGDFKLWYFDTLAQGIIDSGGGIDSEKKQTYEILGQELWLFPKLMGKITLNPSRAEGLRTNRVLDFMRAYCTFGDFTRWIWMDKEQPRDGNVRDHNGVFAVNLSGVASKRVFTK